MSAVEDARLRRFFPATDSPVLRDLLASGITLYTGDEVPAVYQIWDAGNASGVFRVNDSGHSPNANQEFPWASPAGTRPGPGMDRVRKFRFVRLGGPIEWWREARPNGTFARFRWRYAPGTVFGEVMLLEDSQEHSHAWEVRTRTKQPDGGWHMEAYRPFVTEDDLFRVLEKMSPEARGIMQGFPSPTRPPARRVHITSGHQRDAFVADGWEVPLPQLPERTWIALLDTFPFHAVGRRSWRGQPEAVVPSPTSSQDFSLVPRGFLGAFLPVDNRSCMRCHQDAGKLVNLPGDSRWRLRGDDAVWTFHPFEPASIDRGPLELNRKLTAAGLLKHREGLP